MGRKGDPKIAAALRQVLAGDVEAYEIIYRKFDSRLRAFVAARWRWAGPDFVEEVAVRTHERAVRRLAAYDAARGASFLTWLCWQARSVASVVVREWYGPRLVRYDEAALGPVTAAGPADAFEADRRSRVIREELARLPGAVRRSVELHDMAGLTFAETAAAGRTTVWQVRRRRAQALARLRRRLLRRGVRPIEVDTTPAPVFRGWDWTEPDDDWTATVMARLPDGPGGLADAAAAEPAMTP